jgi:hypothetical protein
MLLAFGCLVFLVVWCWLLYLDLMSHKRALASIRSGPNATLEEMEDHLAKLNSKEFKQRCTPFGSLYWDWKITRGKS